MGFGHQETRGSASPGRARKEATPSPADHGRLVIYDGLKLLAALGVVLFHAGVPGRDVWYAGMFVFVFFLGYAPGRPQPWAVLLRTRAQRLLLPWLTWCGVYYILGLYRGTAWIPGTPLEPFSLAIGPAIHLWFLPFAFVCGLVFAVLRPIWPSRIGFNLIGLILLLGAGFVLNQRLSLPAPTGQWLVSLPMATAGFLASIHRRPAEVSAILLISIAVAGAGVTFGFVDGALQTLVSAPFCLIAILWRGRIRPGLAWAGDLAFGIYLIHPAVFLLLWKLTPALGKMPYGFGLAAFAASAAVVAGLRLWPPARRVL
ncbi:acyltransferase family protein [Rhodovulum kholense]|uniref:Acyltransferase-like protein n=1 Tax=Rhodovulum kholense TaxID=453584 RepID=A0A8E2VH69_9RHOB|nr:acyltransferase [Rhodovulum kholense]PTW44003.1 acyltransferase-like protein [Rhodovulum kholense]